MKRKMKKEKKKTCCWKVLGLPCLAASVGLGQLQAQSGLPFEIVEYRPAPGQFVDYTLFLEEGGDVESLDNARVCRILNEEFGKLPFSYLLSLGGFGGSVTVRLKESLPNGDGADFKVYGNAFYDPAYGPGMVDQPGGSAEPGIVWVSRDENGNALPDDAWYELAGARTGDTSTLTSYTITYYLPDSIQADIPWRDSRGATGRIARMPFHAQETYFPLWLSRDSLQYTGRLLAPNARLVEKSPGTEQWVLFSYAWGYADNHPNSSDLSNMDISWAVDSAGNPVDLESIDFVRVVTAVNQQLDRGVGETSTEFAGVEPLQGSCTGLEIPEQGGNFRCWPNPCQEGFWIQAGASGPDSPGGKGLEAGLYDVSGRLLQVFHVQAGQDCRVDMRAFPAGLYVLRIGHEGFKVLKR